MPSFTHEGVTLAYDDVSPAGGSGQAIVLVHGFSSNRKEGWRRTGWYDVLQRRGMRVVALDQRGHGESEKLYEPDAYARGKLASDVLALMDHLGLERADLCGYSMGSRTVLAAALAAPDRVSNLILGGVGGKMIDGSDEERAVSDAARIESMLADDPETISDPMLRSFRYFADEQGEDRRALAAFMSAPRTGVDPGEFARLSMPVLVVAGQRDDLAGDPQELASAFPEAHAVTVPGCDHFSAIPHALTKAAVFDFLDGLLDDPFEGRF